MKKTLALLLAAAMIVMVFAACGNTESQTPSTAAPDDQTLVETIVASQENPVDTTKVKEAVDAGNFKIGIVLLHNEQIGYDAAHIDGINAAIETLGLTSDQVIWKYDVPEDESCYDAAVDLAEQGCNVIFANSFGHESFLMQAAAEYPDILFCHASGQSAAATALPNFVNYFTKVFESRYASGVVAGLKLKELLDSGAITDPYVGYVGAYPYAEVVSGYTAFFQGVRSVVPDAHMDVTYTNSWADQTAEYEAANALMAKGCVIIGQHADTTGAPSAVQAAFDGGNKAVFCVGYNVDMLTAAPDVALTSAQNNWSVVYIALIEAAMKGEPVARNTAYGYEAGGVRISTFGSACAEGTAEKLAEVEAALTTGELRVFDTANFTVDGATLEGYSNSYGFEGLELIWDGYFHESEIISAPLFDIRVDGITELN